MASVGIHPPKTPVTKGSHSVARATIPNICKMPGPPAPFIPSPLPNIAKSGMSPKGFSTSVKIEGKTVAIRGCSFKSMGDMASKGTGGGLLSANTHGPAKFITPGSMSVKIQGKSVHLLSEPMLNNCGPSGMPPNTGATMNGVLHARIQVWHDRLQQFVNECDNEINARWDSTHNPGPKHNDCDADVMYRGERTKVKLALGKAKEDCVYYEKLKCRDGVPKDIKSPNKTETITVQQRFGSDGKVIPPKSRNVNLTGSIVPDIIFRSDGGIVAVRDLKFPCPSGAGRQGRWSDGQEGKYARMLGITPQLIFPK
jgi:uncharacterized Zn-binding protein involved in type VI secretion